MEKHITKKQFWETVRKLRWNQFTTYIIRDDWYKRAKEIIYNEYKTPEDRQAFADRFYEMQSLLENSISSYDKAQTIPFMEKLSATYGFELTRETELDIVSHIIGLGESAFEEAVNDPTYITSCYPYPEAFSYILAPIWIEEGL